MIARRHLWLWLWLLVSFASCKTNELVLIQDKSVLFADEERDSLHLTSPTEYLLQTHDYVYIRIFSPDKVVESELRSQTSVSDGGGQLSTKADYLNGYMVNDSGIVDVPLIGKIAVRGKTVLQAEEALQQEVDKVLINARAVLKLLSFRVVFLGEIGSQGVRYFYQRDLNVLEAIASVGGVSATGRIESVLLLRQEGDAYRSHRIDLSDRKLLSDPLFYLKPNDIVYVQPSRSKLLRQRLADYALVIGTFTSTISTLLLVISLSK